MIHAYLILTSSGDGEVSVVSTGFYRITLVRDADRWMIYKPFAGADTLVG